MDFQTTEMQDTVAGLAAETLARFSGRHVEGVDHEVFEALRQAGLLDLEGLPEIATLLVAVGRSGAVVPAWGMLLGTMALRRFGGRVASGVLITVALNDGEARDPLDPATEEREGRLTGRKVAVPYGAESQVILLGARSQAGAGLYLVEGPVTENRVGTSQEPVADLVLDGIPAVRLGGAEALKWVFQRGVGMACALQLGIAREALALTAKYVSTRHQFGRPIGTFQAVQHRAADAWIDLQAMEVALDRAIWLLSEEREADRAVAIARFHACEGAHRVLTGAQHLHGGIGFDRDYPLHRYFLAGKQLEFHLGGASEWVDRLARITA